MENSVPRGEACNVATGRSLSAVAAVCDRRSALPYRAGFERRYNYAALYSRSCGSRIMNTKKIKDKAERKKLKREARGKRPPKPRRTEPRGSRKPKLKKRGAGAPAGR